MQSSTSISPHLSTVQHSTRFLSNQCFCLHILLSILYLCHPTRATLFLSGVLSDVIATVISISSMSFSSLRFGIDIVPVTAVPSAVVPFHFNFTSIS